MTTTGCIMLTGMSGAGKSGVIAALRRQGKAAEDIDATVWFAYNEHAYQRWHDECLRRCPGDYTAQSLVVSGGAENQCPVSAQCDHIVLLSALPAVIYRRLTERTNIPPYGKRPTELAEVMASKEEIEPLLRRCAAAPLRHS